MLTYIAQFAAPSGTIVWALVGGLELFRLNVTGIRDAQCNSNVSSVDPTHGFVAAQEQDHLPVVSRRSVLDGASPASVPSIASVLGVQQTVMETAVKREV